jgi:hypothetical protein
MPDVHKSSLSNSQNDMTRWLATMQTLNRSAEGLAARHANWVAWPSSFGFGFYFYFYFSRSRGVGGSLA